MTTYNQHLATDTERHAARIAAEQIVEEFREQVTQQVREQVADEVEDWLAAPEQADSYVDADLLAFIRGDGS